MKPIDELMKQAANDVNHSLAFEIQIRKLCTGQDAPFAIVRRESIREAIKSGNPSMVLDTLKAVMEENEDD